MQQGVTSTKLHMFHWNVSVTLSFKVHMRQESGDQERKEGLVIEGGWRRGCQQGRGGVAGWAHRLLLHLLCKHLLRWHSLEREVGAHRCTLHARWIAQGIIYIGRLQISYPFTPCPYLGLNFSTKSAPSLTNSAFWPFHFH